MFSADFDGIFCSSLILPDFSPPQPLDKRFKLHRFPLPSSLGGNWDHNRTWTGRL